MNLKPGIILCITGIIFFTNSYGAFPVKPLTAALQSSNSNTATIEKNAYKQKHNSRSKKILFRALHTVDGFLHRSPSDGRKVAAIICAVLGLLTAPFFVLGIHRMIYGYWGTGIVQFLGGVSFFLGGLLIVVSILGGSLVPILLLAGMLLFLFGAAMWIWQLADLIHIISGRLRPVERHRRESYF